MRTIDADAFIARLDHVPMVKDAIKKAMDHMPTIEPERKKGKWEEREVSSENVIDAWQSARCSVCGLYHTTPHLYYFNGYNYCPNCGSYNGGENEM